MMVMCLLCVVRMKEASFSKHMLSRKHQLEEAKGLARVAHVVNAKVEDNFVESTTFISLKGMPSDFIRKFRRANLTCGCSLHIDRDPKYATPWIDRTACDSRGEPMTLEGWFDHIEVQILNA